MTLQNDKCLTDCNRKDINSFYNCGLLRNKQMYQRIDILSGDKIEFDVSCRGPSLTTHASLMLEIYKITLEHKMT